MKEEGDLFMDYNGNDDTTVLTSTMDTPNQNNPYFHVNTEYEQSQMNYQQNAYNQLQMDYQQDAYNQIQMNYQQNPYNQPQMDYQQNAYNQPQMDYQQNAYNQPQMDYQQMMQQQQLINQMMQQQQQLMMQNQKLQSDLQRKSTGTQPSFKIQVKDKYSLIAALICFLTFVVGNFIKPTMWSDGYNLMEFSDEIEEWYSHMEDLQRFYTWFSSLLPFFLISLIIACLIGGFMYVRTFKIVSLILTAVSTFVIFSQLFDNGAVKYIGGSWLFLIVGMFFALVSIPPKEVPKLELKGVDNYIYENNKKKTNTAIWRCEKCGTKCVGDTCKTCGNKMS